MLDTCLGCGSDLDADDDSCSNCGWDIETFRERGRHGLAKPGHGEPEDDGDGERDGGPDGPPPGPKGLFIF